VTWKGESCTENFNRVSFHHECRRYSYNFIANALNRGFRIQALREGFRYLFQLFKRLGNLQEVTYQSLSESTIHLICKSVERNWKRHYSSGQLHNDFFLVLFCLLRALRMSLEVRQLSLSLNEHSLQVIPLLHLIVDIWSDICSFHENDTLIATLASVLNAFQQEDFLVLRQILRLYEENDANWNLRQLVESCIALYWNIVECQLCTRESDSLKKNASWSSHWLELIADIAFNLPTTVSLSEILRQV